MSSFQPVGTGPVGVGLIGAGNISDTYLENLNSFPDIEVLIVGDLDQARAAEQELGELPPVPSNLLPLKP